MRFRLVSADGMTRLYDERDREIKNLVEIEFSHRTGEFPVLRFETEETLPALDGQVDTPEVIGARPLLEELDDLVRKHNIRGPAFDSVLGRIAALRDRDKDRERPNR